MAKRLYATQLEPGMVLSSGYMVGVTVRHALDRPGHVRVFSTGDDGEVQIELLANDRALPGGVLPEGKVRVRFTDGVVRDMDESSRFKVNEEL